MPHLYLVDGSAYIFRAYHRLPPLTNRHGQPAGAVYGYTAMLWKLVRALDDADGPTHMAVVLDKASTSFRNEMYPDYKAHRPAPPEDLTPQFPMIRDATRAFSLPMIEEENVEADDMLASYARAAEAKGWQTTIVSSDKDLMQLIGPKIDMLDTMKNASIGPAEVEAKFGVLPEKLGDVLALMGDSVDNVPGVPGIGPKTAAKLVLGYGDVEGVLANTDKLKGKQRENLEAHADMARLSRELVRLREDCPLPIPIEDMALDGIPDAPMRAFLEHHGFGSLLVKLDGEARSPAPERAEAVEREFKPIDRSLYETVTTRDALDGWVAEAIRLGVVAVDTETDSLNAVSGGLVGVSLCVGAGRACYIPVDHATGGEGLLAERPDQLRVEEAAEALRPLFAHAGVLKVFHNAKYDLTVLARHDLPVAPIDDTLVMSFDLDAGRVQGHGMDELAKTLLDHQCLTFKEVCGTGKAQCSFAEIPLDRATEYAAEDAEVTWRLWQQLRLRLPTEGATRVYQMVDRPLVPVIARMEGRGVLVDRDHLSRLSGEFATQIATAEDEVHELAGGPFTIGSPKQLGEVLFDKLGLKGGRKGKSGVWSTDVNELERLERDGVPIARKVLEWRQLSKLKTTYTDALQEQIDTRTGRVHTSYSPVRRADRAGSRRPTPTCRISRSAPRPGARSATPSWRRRAPSSWPPTTARSSFAWPPTWPTKPALRGAFQRGDDIHSLTAQELFGTVDRDTRARAKTINFAILYGISRWGLAGRLEITADEAQDMISTYFERFPGISEYIRATLEHARGTGYTETLFGRRPIFPGLSPRTPTSAPGRSAQRSNAPIQGTSADIIKRAMARMEPALADAGLGGVRMLLQVHDELVFEVPTGDVDAATPMIREVMATAALPAVELSVAAPDRYRHGSQLGGGALALLPPFRRENVALHPSLRSG